MSKRTAIPPNVQFPFITSTLYFEMRSKSSLCVNSICFTQLGNGGYSRISTIVTVLFPLTRSLLHAPYIFLNVGSSSNLKARNAFLYKILGSASLRHGSFQNSSTKGFSGIAGNADPNRN